MLLCPANIIGDWTRQRFASWVGKRVNSAHRGHYWTILVYGNGSPPSCISLSSLSGIGGSNFPDRLDEYQMVRVLCCEIFSVTFVLYFIFFYSFVMQNCSSKFWLEDQRKNSRNGFWQTFFSQNPEQHSSRRHWLYRQIDTQSSKTQSQMVHSSVVTPYIFFSITK